MSNELIHDRGRGPEIAGTRITVYNLLPYFLDSAATENSIAELYDLTVEQVAAARAYVLNNAERVLKRHAEIEARMAAGNPPEVAEKIKRGHERFLQFKEFFQSLRWRTRGVSRKTPIIVDGLPMMSPSCSSASALAIHETWIPFMSRDNEKHRDFMATANLQ